MIDTDEGTYVVVAVRASDGADERLPSFCVSLPLGFEKAAL
jgi:hypothetical protein